MENKKNHQANIVRLGEPRVLVDGKSAVDNKTMREGFVIRPVKERHVRGLGRLILKVVSNKFLEKDNL